MWFKMSMYEWSVRVPLIISWPEKYSHHRVSKNVSLIDLLPTLVDFGRQSEKLAVNPIEKLSGHSLLTLLTRQDDSNWPDIAISDFTAGGVPGPLRMVKKGHWKLICVGDYPPQLFDLKTDPDERIDRSDDPQASEILNQLLAIACDGYDSALINQQVRTSQRRRLLIKDVDSLSGAPELWNWTVQPDDDKRFVRSGGLQHGEHATKAKARFPFIAESH
jgi:choline-sulfatase